MADILHKNLLKLMVSVAFIFTHIQCSVWGKIWSSRDSSINGTYFSVR